MTHPDRDSASPLRLGDLIQGQFGAAATATLGEVRTGALRALSSAFECPPQGELDDLGRRLATRLPEYAIEELFGRGGMGAVYRARQRRLRRPVAIKVLLSPTEGIDPRLWRQRFEREALALARLQHPNVVTVYDFGQEQDLAWIVMELVEGVNLRQLLRGGALSEAEALDIARQLGSALQFAHEQGVVHRDVKPENVLVTERGHVKVVDFGVAKLEGPAGITGAVLTGTQQAVGSATYVAPELLQGPRQADHRVDTYGFGVVLYEMLTGQLPVGNFPPPSSFGRTRPELDPWVLRALATNPDERPDPLQELLTQLTPAPVAGPEHAAPPAALPTAVQFALETRRAWFVVGLCALGIASMDLTWLQTEFVYAEIVTTGWETPFALITLLALATPLVQRVAGFPRRIEARVDLVCGLLAVLLPFWPWIHAWIRDSETSEMGRGNLIGIACGALVTLQAVLALRTAKARGAEEGATATDAAGSATHRRPPRG
jgi:tRNA A-37 threonylcarbamoyl transferase component Bud32